MILGRKFWGEDWKRGRFRLCFSGVHSISWGRTPYVHTTLSLPNPFPIPSQSQHAEKARTGKSEYTDVEDENLPRSARGEMLPPETILSGSF